MRMLSACPACGGNAIAQAYTEGAWVVWRCNFCEHGFLNPQLDWNELAPYYTADYVAYAPDGGLAEDDEAVLSTARKAGELCHIPVHPGQRLLDVGCGGGRFVRLAGRMGLDAEGIDPSPIAVASAQAAGLNVSLGTLEAFVATHRDPRFDIVTMNHVLEHVPDPVQTLRSIPALLRPGGRLCVTVPNARCGASWRLRGKWHSADLPRHLMHFSARSLACCAERAGLLQVLFKTYSLPKATASSIRIWLRIRCGIPGSVSRRCGIDSWLAPRIASRMDERKAGEALIMFFAAANDAASVPD